MKAALTYVATFHDNIQVLIKKSVAMITVVPQHARHFGRLLGFFKNFSFCKIAGNFCLEFKLLRAMIVFVTNRSKRQTFLLSLVSMQVQNLVF